MIRRLALAASPLGAALSFSLAAPLAAQDTAPPATEAERQAMDDFSAMMGQIFAAPEPLTPEQEAVLPMAREVVAQIFPEGTYARMMSETMKPMMDTIMGSFMDLPRNQIVTLTGLYGEDFSRLDETQVDQAMAILDPAFDPRSKAIADVTLTLVSDVMTEIEPAYRAGLARAYAVRFTEAELADLKRYFSTPTGSKYARESMLIYADPQVMAAMNELMPAIMGTVPQMLERMQAINAEFPEPRRFSQLTDREQAQLAELLGVSLEELSAAEPEDLEESEGAAAGEAAYGEEPAGEPEEVAARGS